MFLWRQNVAWDFYMASYSAALTKTMVQPLRGSKHVLRTHTHKHRHIHKDTHRRTNSSHKAKHNPLRETNTNCWAFFWSVLFLYFPNFCQ